MTVQTAIGPRVVGPRPHARPRRRRGVLTLSRFWMDLLRWDALFAFGILAPQMFALQLKSLSPAISLLFSLITCFYYRQWFFKILANRWFMLSIPVMSLASVTWSAYPDMTLKYALEMSILAVSMLVLSASRRPMAVLAGATAAFALFLIVSVALGSSVAMTIQGTGGASVEAFAGLNGGKNFMGMTACLSVLITIAFIVAAVQARSATLVAVATVVLCIELYAGIAARSAGALIGLVAALGVFWGAVALSRLSTRWRIGAIVLMSILMLLAAAFSGLIVREVMDFASTAFNKDPTLTGRTYLWYRGQDLIQERPLLGRGFAAFWVQGNLDAEGLWQYGNILQRSGFNFHNTVMELLIHYGWVGTSMAIASSAIAAIALGRRIVMSPSLPACFYLGFVAFELTRMPLESLAPGPNDFESALLFLALGFGFRSVPVNPMRKVRFRPMRSMKIATPVAFQPQFQLVPGPVAAPRALPSQKKRLTGPRR